MELKTRASMLFAQDNMDAGSSHPLLMLLGLLLLVWELAGIASAVHAVMVARTSQGAIAWAISLVTFPWVALPAYWVFGTSKFEGYVKSRREGTTVIHEVVRQAGQVARERELEKKASTGEQKVLQRLARLPFMAKNNVQLLVNGKETFDSIFQAIDSATDYIAIQFFIVKDDQLGQDLKSRLIEKARQGVRVYFLFDEIGSHKLYKWLRRPGPYLRELEEAGVEIKPFHSARRNRFQINFRNHRKILVVDGRVAFVGGLNVGDEYMGRSERFGHWRDTHARIVGPAVHATQLSFLEDWYWATREVPEMDWSPKAADNGDMDVLVLPSGPADNLESCGLFFVQMINSAKDRIWIASPYFVPDLHVISALQLAALRGVDVRIILPEKPDHLLVYLSGFSFLEEAELAGVKIYRYQPGFLHHKVLLVDERVAAVGTANLDNRSFRLNFEITLLVENVQFAAEMANMLENDLENCKLADPADLHRRSMLFQIAVRLSRLMAPLQ